MLYAGLAEPNYTLSDADDNEFANLKDGLREVVLGLRGTAPLSASVGLTGGVHYVMPSASATTPFSSMDEESWNITIGLVWVRGCSLPILPTADNGWLGKRVNINVPTAPAPPT